VYSFQHGVGPASLVQTWGPGQKQTCPVKFAALCDVTSTSTCELCQKGGDVLAFALGEALTVMLPYMQFVGASDRVLRPFVSGHTHFFRQFKWGQDNSP
jgi:hypothetical protein